MKRLWIIPLIFIIILSGLWFFRWEKGPTQNEKNLKIQHIRDSWTGQAWTISYGNRDGEFVSSVEEPYISKQDIKKRINELTKTSDFKDIISLTDKIEKTVQRVKQLNPDHKKFMIKATDAESKRYLNYLKRKPLFLKDSFEFAWETDVGDWDTDSRWSMGLMPQLPTKGKVAELIKANVPKNLINAENEYRKCFKILADARAKREVLQNKVMDLSKKTLIEDAHNTRKVATIIWISTLITFIVLVIVLFILDYRKVDRKEVL